jgi:LPS sulfotransferase NodH
MPDPDNIRPFIVLTSPRTGSTHLISMLGQHPRIAVYMEPFNGALRSRSEVRGRTVKDREDGAEFARYLFAHPDAPAAVGFKLMYQHARRGAIATVWPYLAKEPRLVVIDLVRDNLLEVIVSHRLAEVSGIWQIKAGRDAPERGKIRISARDCIQYFDEYHRDRAWALAHFKAHTIIPVSYEELCSQPQAVLDKIFPALGVEKASATPEQGKIEQLSMQDRIEDYGALRTALSTTPYARYAP